MLWLIAQYLWTVKIWKTCAVFFLKKVKECRLRDEHSLNLIDREENTSTLYVLSKSHFKSRLSLMMYVQMLGEC